mgnify:CR=1 FL=1
MEDVLTQFKADDFDFTRVAVIGCPGSGKTTFSNNLGHMLGRKVTHLDKLLWKPNWQMPPYDERDAIHSELINGEEWIIDGMWKSHLPKRIMRATLVIFLDYKRSVSLSRACERRIAYRGCQREDIADGCLEKLDSYFIKYIWNFQKQTRPLILQLLERKSESQVVAFSSPKEARVYLQQLATAFLFG